MAKKRVGMVIKFRLAKAEGYRAAHADSDPRVRDLLEKYNPRNYSIFSRTIDDGNEYLFGYYEYTGDGFVADHAVLNAEDRNAEWLEICDTCREPLQGETSWAIMDDFYYNE